MPSRADSKKTEAIPEVEDGRNAGALKGQRGVCEPKQPGSGLCVPDRRFVGSQEQGRVARAVLGQEHCCYPAHFDGIAQGRSCPVHVQGVHLHVRQRASQHQPL